ncbi:unknown [Collinsella sp. CAG:398]|nr:unknown [Collinsella sp. CAG:398]
MGGVADLLDLLLGGVAEGVAAERDDDTIGLADGLGHGHSFPPKVCKNVHAIPPKSLG